MTETRETAATTRRSLKALPAASLRDLTPAADLGEDPVFQWVAPTDLVIDDAYQRQLSEKSITLIRKIVAGWDWRKFKPPIVAMTATGLEVIDGQHTAMAAASHPGVAKIPVMVVAAVDQAARASAFVGHNRDRLQMTPMQLHHAAVAAGDESALTVQQVCNRAGVTILRMPPGNGAFKPGDCMAVGTIAALCNRRSAQSARIILQVLAEAGCAPVGANQIKAVEMLLHDTLYRGEVQPADITSAIIALREQAETEARLYATAQNVPLWRALGVIYFRRATRGRRRAG